MSREEEDTRGEDEERVDQSNGQAERTLGKEGEGERAGRQHPTPHRTMPNPQPTAKTAPASSTKSKQQQSQRRRYPKRTTKKRVDTTQINVSSDGDEADEADEPPRAKAVKRTSRKKKDDESYRPVVRERRRRRRGE